MLNNSSKNIDKAIAKIKAETRFTVQDFYQKNKNTYEISLKFGKSLEPSVFKETIIEIYKTLERLKIKQTLIVKVIDPNNNLLIFSKEEDVPTVIDIKQTLEARFPESKVPYVSSSQITVTTDVNNYARTALKTALVLKEHFLENLTSNFDLTVEVVDSLSITYQFKWFQVKVITETIVNSNRYYEMISFVDDLPHPDVKLFHFKFRDSNKGFYSELDLVYKNQMSPKETLETSDFIRDKLRGKFSHLPIY